MNRFLYTGCFVLLLSLAFGCASSGTSSRVYDLTFDQTYDLVAASVDDLKDWRLVETDQLSGIVIAEYPGYFLPRREQVFRVQRVEPHRTRVQADSSRSVNHEAFWQAIERRLNDHRKAYPR